MTYYGHSFKEADEYLGSKQDRPLTGRNTRLVRRSEDTIAVHYSATDVITYMSSGAIAYNSDGWQTPTTKQRFHAYGSTQINIWQDHGLWYVHPSSGGWRDTPALGIYQDGMTVWPNGDVTGLLPIDQTEQLKRKVDKLVKRYIDGFWKHIEDNRETGLEVPSSGDCWPCLFALSAEPPPGRGHEVMGFDHYIAHFEDKYYVPSLLWRAYSEAGYQDYRFNLGLLDMYLKEGRDLHYEKENVKRHLRHFFARRKEELTKLV